MSARKRTQMSSDDDDDNNDESRGSAHVLFISFVIFGGGVLGHIHTHFVLCNCIGVGYLKNETHHEMHRRMQYAQTWNVRDCGIWGDVFFFLGCCLCTKETDLLPTTELRFWPFLHHNKKRLSRNILPVYELDD